MQFSYKGCLLGSVGRRDWRVSSLVFNIVIFLRAADKCRCVSGPEEGKEFLAEIIEPISSASLDASLNSRIHESADDAIDS